MKHNRQFIKFSHYFALLVFSFAWLTQLTMGQSQILRRPKFRPPLKGTEILLEADQLESKQRRRGIWALEPKTGQLRFLIPNGTRPFWSPKRNYIAYQEYDKIKVIDKTGRIEVTAPWSIANGQLIGWGYDEEIILCRDPGVTDGFCFFRFNPKELSLTDVGVVAPYEHFPGHHFGNPKISPDGKYIVFEAFKYAPGIGKVSSKLVIAELTVTQTRFYEPLVPQDELKGKRRYFDWDGSVNVMPPPPPPDGLAPTGLYVFDVEVIGVAPGYDEDAVRSKMLRIGEHEVIFPLPAAEQQPFFYPSTTSPARALYVLRGAYPALKVRIDVYDTEFNNLKSINGTTITIPEDAPIDVQKDVNDVPFTLPHLEIKSPYPFTFVFWAWDSVPQFYKNHTVKTTFANEKQPGPPQGHFVAGGTTGVGGDMRKWFINNILPFLRRVKRWLPDKFGRWGWRQAPISFGYWVWDGPGTQPSQMHPVQEWNRDIVLKRIAHVEILTLMAHGNHDKMGRKGLFKGFDLITSNDIRQRYSGYWTIWNPITRRQETRQGLHHLRVVLLIGCKTGGSSGGSEEEMEATPAEGSLAYTFYQLCANIVIYSNISGWGPVNEEFVKRFYYYATAEGMTIVQAAKKRGKN